MTHPNPFAQNVPAAPEQPATAPNPYAQPAAAPAAPQQAPNPFAQQQAAPAAPQAYAPAQQAPQANPYGGQQGYAPHPAPAGPYGQTTYAPPAQTHVQQPVQAYAPAPQQGALPALGTATAPPPPAPSGGRGAKLPDMYGRLVIIFPHLLQRVPKNAKFVTDTDRANGNLEQDRMTATVVVLDGGSPGNMTPIAFGGNPHVVGGRPHDKSEPLPYVNKGMWLNQSQLIGQVSDYLPGRAQGGPGGTPGAAVGRLVKTAPEQNAPWYLTTPTPEELNLANQYLHLVMENRFPHPLAP